MLLASAPVIEPISSGVISNYGPLAGCLDQHIHGQSCGTATAAILAQAANQSSVLVVVDAALPQELEAHQDAFFLEASALKTIEALPFPPPVPSPPLPCALRSAAQQCQLPPAPKAGTCYTLGTELCGLCEITSKVSTWHIIMQCGAGGDPSTVIADYADSAGWAGQTGNHFGGLRSMDVPCTQIRLEYVKSQTPVSKSTFAMVARASHKRTEACASRCRLRFPTPGCCHSQPSVIPTGGTSR